MTSRERNAMKCVEGHAGPLRSMTRPAVIVVLCLISTGAAATSDDRHGGWHARPVHHATQHRRDHARIASRFGEAAPRAIAMTPGVRAYHWPGYYPGYYTYVPRRGIVDDACNLPS